MDILLQKTLIYAAMALFWLIFYHFIGFEVTVLMILLIITVK
jgi:hypothetical protein